MNNHILEWLPAYHDDELPAYQRQQVKDHLEICPVCRTELQTLLDLSMLLKSDPLPQLTFPERFAAQVHLLLPRSAPPRLQKPRLPGWVLATPLALVVIWAFVQAGVWLTSFTLGTSLIFPVITPSFLLEDSLGIPGTLLVLNLVLSAGLVVLLSAWTALWHRWKQQQNPSSVFTYLGKEV